MTWRLSNDGSFVKWSLDPLVGLLVLRSPQHALTSAGPSWILGKHHGSFSCQDWWHQSLLTVMRYNMLNYEITTELITQTMIAARCVVWGMQHRQAHNALDWIPSFSQSLSNASYMVSLFDVLSAMITITYMLHRNLQYYLIIQTEIGWCTWHLRLYSDIILNTACAMFYPECTPTSSQKSMIVPLSAWFQGWSIELTCLTANHS